MTHNRREAERQISKSSESGAVDTTRLEEDGANGSDTVDLSWLDIAFVDLPYSIHIKRHLRAHG
ncbi:MAG: hypothetical protein VXX23_05090 [Actinomycetota bacterium]|nr:hypothetical protein [Actinomycetota bacterium]